MKNKLFKKKIFHRAKYRGIKELDIIFERFCSKYENSISLDDLNQLEQILNLPDSELLDIIYKKAEIPSNLKGGILRKILKNCNDKN